MSYEIHQHGTGFTFLVSSMSRGNIKHVVDLEKETCTCENWMCRLSRPEMRDKPKESRRCKHIKACREWLVDYVISKAGE